MIFNAHRIHYDEPYTTSVERYPALVVQGPLAALLLADLAERSDLLGSDVALAVETQLVNTNRMLLHRDLRDAARCAPSHELLAYKYRVLVVHWQRLAQALGIGAVLLISHAPSIRCIGQWSGDSEVHRGCAWSRWNP